MLDALVISDIHLGSDACLAERVAEFLEQVPEKTSRLILNGDVFDSIDMRRLTKHHWHVLSRLRKMSDDVEVIWLAGNHDGPAEVISHLLGVRVMKDYIMESGDQRILILHGDRFDRFIDDHPWITWVGDTIYGALQKLDRSHYWARLAKTTSKQYLRCSELVKERAIRYAASLGCDMVCCGHTHDAEVCGNYYNSGCWTEMPGTYLEINAGHIVLKTWGEIILPQT